MDNRPRAPVSPDNLGKDFVAIVGRVGSQLVEVVSLTRLSFREDRTGCYRLRFADGRIFKYRRMVSARGAETVERLISRIDAPNIPRVVDRHGAGLLIEFVDGGPVRRRGQTRKLLVETAALQGKIHLTEAADLLAGEPPLRMSDEAVDLGRRIDRLTARKAITRHEADRLTELAISQIPQECQIGVVHRDYCAENLLVSDAGDFYIVDNEAIRIGPFDFDLARTWYRWPMSPTERAVYWESYGEHRDLSSFSSSFLFWAIDVMVRSALYRLQGGTVWAAVPIRKLRILLRRAQTPVPPDSYLRW